MTKDENPHFHARTHLQLIFTDANPAARVEMRFLFHALATASTWFLIVTECVRAGRQ